MSLRVFEKQFPARGDCFAIARNDSWAKLNALWGRMSESTPQGDELFESLLVESD